MLLDTVRQGFGHECVLVETSCGILRVEEIVRMVGMFWVFGNVSVEGGEEALVLVIIRGACVHHVDW
jgi:hypothetical protein